MAPRTLLTEAQAAERLGTSPRILQDWRLSGRLVPSYATYTNRPKYDAANVEAWLAARFSPTLTHYAG